MNHREAKGVNAFLEKPRKIRVMQADAHGRLRWRTAWQFRDNPPQATRKLALNWAKTP